MFHKYKTKTEAQKMFRRYGNIHNRSIQKMGSQWVVVGNDHGHWHALGDHGWAFDLSRNDLLKMPDLDVDWDDALLCDQCGESTSNGDGWDGLCGDCADKES